MDYYAESNVALSLPLVKHGVDPVEMFNSGLSWFKPNQTKNKINQLDWYLCGGKSRLDDEVGVRVLKKVIKVRNRDKLTHYLWTTLWTMHETSFHHVATELLHG